MVEEKIGVVEHFFNKISVAAIKLTDGKLTIGDTIHIVGTNTDVKETVSHMEINRVSVTTAKAGDAIGIKTLNRVRERDVVYKIPKGE